MKQSIAIAVGLCALCHVGFAFIFFPIDAPQDDTKVRARVGDRPELKPLHAAYSDIIHTRLWPLKFDAVPKIFGPKLDTATNWAGFDVAGRGAKLHHHPANLALPLFAPSGMVLSGLGVGPGCKSHTDLSNSV